MNTSAIQPIEFSDAGLTLYRNGKNTTRRLMSQQPMHDTDAIAEFTLRLHDAVGSEAFRPAMLEALETCRPIPVTVAHAMRFDPRSGSLDVFDKRGPASAAGRRIPGLIAEHAHSLPRFQSAVDTSPEPAVLSALHSREEVEESAMYKHVISKVGAADVAHIPLMQAETRNTLVLGHAERYALDEVRRMRVVQQHCVIAMRNHFWLQHALHGQSHLAEVSGHSVVLEIEGGTVPDWAGAVAQLAERAGLTDAPPTQPPQELLRWLELIVGGYPLISLDRSTIPVTLEPSGLALRATFLGQPNGAHKLLLFQPRGVPAHFNLTPREIDVLRLLCQHKSNAEIAEMLGISAFTARNVVQRILDKLPVDSRYAAAKMAQGWFDFD